jgi:hypothetical protein
MKSWMLICAVLLAPAAATGAASPQQITAAPVPLPGCADTVRDQATGSCVGVSSTPTIGMLFPLSSDFYIGSYGSVFMANGLYCGGTVDAAYFSSDFFVGGYVYGDELVAGTDGLHVVAGGRVGVGLDSPTADLHIKRQTDAKILVEADSDNVGESDHPEIVFSQDGGLVQAFVGFQDGENDIAIRNLYAGGGLRFDLHTSSTRDWEFRRRATSGLDVEARLTQSGSLQLDGSVSSPAADLAEFYPVLGTVEPGDVVAFSGQGLGLERARAGADGRLAGVISSRPAFAMGLSYTVEDELGVEPESLLAGEPYYGGAARLSADPAVTHEIQVNGRAPLALVGRVPVKISDENGPIQVGDPLTASSTPGFAMRSTEAGAVIGTALEPWSSGRGKILVFCRAGWRPPSPTPRESAELRDELSMLRSQVASLIREVESLRSR